MNVMGVVLAGGCVLLAAGCGLLWWLLARNPASWSGVPVPPEVTDAGPSRVTERRANHGKA